MRKRLFVFSLVLFVNGMVSFLLGQEKSQAYYNQHPNEILHDAQNYFKKGDYEKTISLCKLHYIIVGDSAADALRSKAELCERLTNEINERTEELRSANPDDPIASKLNPVKTALDSIQDIINSDESTSDEGFKDGKYTPDTEADTAISELEKTINGNQWVDLGLPSGLKWATLNIGAEKASDYGYHFSWEEVTKQKNKRSSVSDVMYRIMSKAVEQASPYWSERSSSQQDIATVFWGSPWRMPDDKDWDELKKYCNWRWMTMNGRAGYLVVSRKNGNSIFLPASGYFERKTKDVGQEGYYWSSTPDNGERINANSLFYFKESRTKMMAFPTSVGASIRAVSD